VRECVFIQKLAKSCCLSQWLLPATATSSSDAVSVCRCCQDSAGLHIQSIGLLQLTAVWRVWWADASSTMGPERRRKTCNRRAAPWLRDHITPILRQLHWLPVRQRVTFKIAVLVFQCLTG